MPACPVCPATSLELGGALDGAGCARCGGLLVPSTGSERLLEELRLGRAQLREIAEGYAGTRHPCPACRSRMRPLVLFGVDVTWCFGCGAAWLAHGALERLTKGRHGSPPRPTTSMTTATRAPMRRPTAPVRVDLRPLWARVSGSTLRIVGSVGAALWMFPVPHAPVLGVLALWAAGSWLRRGDWLDVHPRAQRYLRSGRVVPPDAEDPAMQKLDDDARLVLRPSLPGLVRPILVDGAGRELCPLPRMARVFTHRRARALSRRLGVTPIAGDDDDDNDDNRAGDDARAAAALVHPALVGPPVHDVWRLAPDEEPGRRDNDGVLRLGLVNGQQRRIGELRNDVPHLARVTPGGRHALCFALRDSSDVPLLRLHDAAVGKRAWSVIVDGNGTTRAAVARPRRAWERWRCVLARSDVEVTLTGYGLDASQARGAWALVSRRGVVGEIGFPSARWAGDVRWSRAPDASDDEVFASLCLWLHVAIERTPT